MITVGGVPPRSSLFFPSVPPSISINSSLTIVRTCCAREKLPRTSAPIAFSLTRSTNWRTTLRLTSASNNASRTSRIASLTSASVSLPLPLKLVKTPSRRFDKLSNIAIIAYVLSPPVNNTSPIIPRSLYGDHSFIMRLYEGLFLLTPIMSYEVVRGFVTGRGEEGFWLVVGVLLLGRASLLLGC